MSSNDQFSNLNLPGSSSQLRRNLIYIVFAVIGLLLIVGIAFGGYTLLQREPVDDTGVASGDQDLLAELGVCSEGTPDFGINSRTGDVLQPDGLRVPQNTEVLFNVSAPVTSLQIWENSSDVNHDPNASTFRYEAADFYYEDSSGNFVKYTTLDRSRYQVVSGFPASQNFRLVTNVGSSDRHGVWDLDGVLACIVDQAPRGSVGRIDCDGTRCFIRGWACDPDLPNETLTVQVFLDSVSQENQLRSPSANLSALNTTDGAQIAAICGTSDHRFEFSVPREYKDGGTYDFVFRAVSTDFEGNTVHTILNEQNNTYTCPAACQNEVEQYLECVNNSCQIVVGSGENQDGCTSAGQDCGYYACESDGSCSAVSTGSSGDYISAGQCNRRCEGCGDGVCNLDETNATCPADCPVTCGDGICSADESAATCPADCPAVCGDGQCTHTEDVVSCPDDCDPICGDGICSPPTETSATCSADCGEPTSPDTPVTTPSGQIPDTGILSDDNLLDYIVLGFLLMLSSIFVYRARILTRFVESVEALGSSSQALRKGLKESKKAKKERKREEWEERF